MSQLQRTNRMRRLAVGAMLAVLAASAGTPAEAAAFQQLPDGVKVVTKTRYYEVHGRTVAELAADLLRQGPRDAEGRAQAGSTSSPLTWRYITRASGSECSAFDVQVTVNTRVLLPRWVPPADTEPGLYAQWTASMDALAVHERGHQEISVRFATQIRDRIAALRVPCSSFTARARRASSTLVASIRAAQAAYDSETRHGLAQGTGFPPLPPVP